jgi:penicillin amidase
LRSTLSAAVEKVQRLLGDEPATWSWGRLHQATFHHRLECLGPEVAQALNLGPVPRGGTDHTPMNTKHDADFQQIHGATYRHVLDLADWDRGLATSAPGQSGQPGSPHYGDLLPLWADGQYFPLAYSRGKVEEVTRHRLLLTPQTRE